MDDKETPPTAEELDTMEEMAAIGYTVTQAAMDGTPSLVMPNDAGGYVVMLLVDAPPTMLAALEALVSSAHTTIPLRCYIPSGTEEEIEARLKVVTSPSPTPDNTWTRVAKKKK